DRASIETLLQAQFADFETRHVPFGILLIQIEGMGRVDAMYGRPAEDEITAELTDTLSRCMCQDDHLGWWSENRLLAIVPGCGRVALAEIVETLQDLVAQTAVPWWGDRLRARIKVSSADVRQGDSPESLVTRCVEALEV